MTISEKIDASLISLLLRDSLDQTAFSNKRSDFFYIVKESWRALVLHHIGQGNKTVKGQQGNKDPEGSNQDALFEC